MSCLTSREYGAVYAHASAISALLTVRGRVQRDIDDAALVLLWVGILAASLEARTEDVCHG